MQGRIRSRCHRTCVMLCIIPSRKVRRRTVVTEPPHCTEERDENKAVHNGHSACADNTAPRASSSSSTAIAARFAQLLLWACVGSCSYAISALQVALCECWSHYMSAGHFVAIYFRAIFSDSLTSPFEGLHCQLFQMGATKPKSAARTVDALAACNDSTTVFEVRCVLPLLILHALVSIIVWLM